MIRRRLLLLPKTSQERRAASVAVGLPLLLIPPSPVRDWLGCHALAGRSCLATALRCGFRTG